MTCTVETASGISQRQKTTKHLFTLNKNRLCADCVWIRKHIGYKVCDTSGRQQGVTFPNDKKRQNIYSHWIKIVCVRIVCGLENTLGIKCVTLAMNFSKGYQYCYSQLDISFPNDKKRQNIYSHWIKIVCVRIVCGLENTLGIKCVTLVADNKGSHFPTTKNDKTFIHIE